mgnify:CR=1 FL=1
MLQMLSELLSERKKIFFDILGIWCVNLIVFESIKLRVPLLTNVD